MRVLEQKTEYGVDLELGQRSWLIRIMPMELFNEIWSVFA